MSQYNNYAQKGRLGDIANNVVSAPGRLLKRGFAPQGEAIGWNDDRPNIPEAKRQQKIAVATSLATGASLIVAMYATNPILGLFASGVGAINFVHLRNANFAYKIAKIDGLLAKEDASELLAMVAENKKLAAKLEAYQGVDVRDIPEDLKKQSYAAIVRQYKTMKNLTAALEKAKNS